MPRGAGDFFRIVAMRASVERWHCPLSIRFVLLCGDRVQLDVRGLSNVA
jgi:hypothetical protein